MKTDKDPVQKKGGGVLGFIERVGNALPDPSILFLIRAVFVHAQAPCDGSYSIPRN